MVRYVGVVGGAEEEAQRLMTAAEDELQLRDEEAAQVRGSFLVRLWRYIIALFILCSTAPAWAAIPEVCANGRDDAESGHTKGACPAGWVDAKYGDGCDLLCLGRDKDNDGYNLTDSPIDCDDTDFFVLPGQYYSTDGGTTYRKCHDTAGTWGSPVTSSVTPLCEKTGSGNCYYVSFANGNDTTGNGSFANPWKTLRCVGYWASGAPGCNVTPPDGSVVYLLDGGTYTDSYNAGGNYGTLVMAIDETRGGTATDKLIIKRYPGATVVIQAPGSSPSTERSAIRIADADYVELHDLAVTGGYGSPIQYRAESNGANYGKVERLFVYDIDGISENNLAGIYTNGVTNFTLSRSLIVNVFDLLESSEDPGQQNYGNVTAWVIFNDDTGGDHSVLYTRTGSTYDPTTADSEKMGCGKFKHGADASTHSGNLIKGNICWNVYTYGFESYSSEVTAENNLVVVGRKVAGFLIGEDADSYTQDAVIRFNTVIDGRLFNISSDATGATYHTDPYGPIQVSNNINVDNVTYAGDEYGVSLDQYASDAQVAIMDAAMTMGDNCYYNSAASYKWNIGGAPSGSGGHGPAGNAGTATTSLATWQSVIADSNSFLEDADLDASHRATSANCDDKGWRLVADEEPNPTPTPLYLLCKRRRR